MPGVQLIYDSTCVSTSNISCTWTVPTGVCRVTFEIWGGGGGAGVPGTNCNCCQIGGPGAGGGYSKVTVNTVPGCQYTMVVGAAGVATNAFGALNGICCNGCAGGTTYITGFNLTNFCATGGCGGLGDFNTNCYSYCGCNFYSRPGGQGYGGDIVAQGTWGTASITGGQNAYNIVVLGGTAGGPGGGPGGINSSLGYCSGFSCAINGETTLHGRIPGGGGAGSGCWSTCVCCPYNTGRGAPGMIKITY